MTCNRQQWAGIGLAVFLHLGIAAWWAGTRATTPPRALLETMAFSLQSAEAAKPPAPQAAPTPAKVQRAPAPHPTPMTRATEAAERPAADAPSNAPANAAPAPTAPAGGPTTEQPAITPPRFDAAYLANPAPPYPGLSRRLNEQGRVLLRVRVGADGLPLSVEIAQSSGFPRLDAAAREAVLGWKFAPARQGERAVAASVNVPIAFKLN